MPRKGLRPRDRRGLPVPDFKCNLVLVARFINKINYKGKKNTAERVIYDSFDLIKEKTKEDPLQVFTKAIENVRPLLEVRPRRVGGATYQVPMEVPSLRSSTIAMRWIINAARERKGMAMAKRLAEEIILAYKKEGAAFKKREDAHRMAEANRVFAHYRW
jgi:small subunit ribosomal protein S7